MAYTRKTLERPEARLRDKVLFQDEVFFQRYGELSDKQIRFYLGLRRESMLMKVATKDTPRKGTAGGHLEYLKQAMRLRDQGFIILQPPPPPDPLELPGTELELD